jgi:hypothetical protein
VRQLVVMCYFEDSEGGESLPRLGWKKLLDGVQMQKVAMQRHNERILLATTLRSMHQKHSRRAPLKT